jgi:DNA-binding HxlR family transcriptional regulator
MEDNKIIIEALKQKKLELLTQVAQLDKHIKELQGKDNNSSSPVINSMASIRNLPNNQTVTNPLLFKLPKTNQVKAEVLGLFDFFNRPVRMSELQEKFMEGKTLSDFHIRETVRSLNKSGVVKLMKINESNRNSYWVKTDWIDKATKRLKDEYKWEGFDSVFSPDELKFV